MTRRIAIVGASGLVGTALASRLSTGSDELVLLIHSSGNAWRLASRGFVLRQVDLLDRAAVSRALDGCSHVVNCSRGDDVVMIRGLGNLLAASKIVRIQRLVHLSSVAVYGDRPPSTSVTEDAPAKPEKGSYGWIKLQQDAMVERAAQSGLSAMTLCPPNIGGPYSYFLNALVARLRDRQFALLDDGSACCNLVDVSNLAVAIELALDKGDGEGTRIFVTDGEAISWRDVIRELAPLAGVRLEEVPTITREELVRRWPPPKTRISLVATAKHLLSPEVRQTLRKDPLLDVVDQTLRGAFALFGQAAETRVRRSVQTQRPSPECRGAKLNYELCAQQLRGVRHSCARANQVLGYVPSFTFKQSCSAFVAWYRWHHGLDGPFSDLLAELMRG